MEQKFKQIFFLEADYLLLIMYVWRCQTLGHGRNCFLFSFAVHTVLSTLLLVKITFIRKFLFPWSLICNFICFVFKKPECQWTYFEKQVWDFFQHFKSFIWQIVQCLATPLLASDEVVTYWACRRVSRSLFIVTSFSVDRAWSIKLFFIQKVEVV